MSATTGQPPLPDAQRPCAKILVVDDRPDKLLAFQATLQELGQNVFTATSGDEALKLVLEHEFAVILLDVNMPGLDGLETAALIRKRKKSAHTPIIFITAYADEMLTMQGYSLGAVDYILSPVVPDILRTKVKVFVDLFCLTESAKQQVEERVALAREQAARTAAEEAGRRSDLLADASRALTGALDFATRVHELFTVIVPSMADMCGFMYLDEQGAIECTELAWTMDGKPLKTVRCECVPLSLAPAVEAALSSRETQSFGNGGSPPPREMTVEDRKTNSEVLPPLSSGGAFPLLARGRLVGVLCFALFDAKRQFDNSDWLFLEDLANRSAIALDNALLYQQLETADRHKNDFLAMLGHELRNPLAPILNAVDLLRISGEDPGRLKLVTGVIERQVRNLTRLVDDLLDISRITRGKLELRCSVVDVSGMVSSAVETSMPLIQARKHRLTVSQPPQPLWVNADAGRLAQVLSNLLNNAAKYTPNGGSISLKVDQEDDEVVFRVTDTGVGLSKKMLSGIFDLFAQGERPTNSFHDGLGVGLTLVRRLVELHGGNVNAFSAGPNQGSEFVVRLPALHDGAGLVKPAAVTAPGAPPSTNLRVLIVDDNRDALETTAMLVKHSGFEVRTAQDGAAALEAASEFNPDVALLDIGMPGMDGYELARRLRAQPSGDRIRMIAVSGYGQERDRQRSIQAGFDNHFTKPLDHSLLIEILRSLSSNRRAVPSLNTGRARQMAAPAKT
jgi:signal transduction histidine kinase/DNA-binding response OmpR family regulator